MEEPGTRALERVGEAMAFYRSMVEDLNSLSRQSADITWVPDARPRRRSDSAQRSMAPTGRLVAKSEARHRKLSHLLEGPKLGGGGPAPVEVTTRKPAYLAEVRTRPEPAIGRRGSQPRSQAQAAGDQRRHQGVRLRLGTADPRRGVPRPAPEPVVRKPWTPPKQSRAVGSDVVTLEHVVPQRRDAAVEPVTEQEFGRFEVLPQEPEMRVRPSASLQLSRSLRVPSSRGSSPRSSPRASSPRGTALSSPREPPAPKPKPALAKAQLIDVIDLQLVLPQPSRRQPKRKASAPPPAQEPVAPPTEPKPTEPVAAAEPPVSGVEEPVPLPARAPPLRPVIRGLIADVITEMLPSEPAEVEGGVELHLRGLRPPPPPRHQRAAPLDEDTMGQRLGVLPPSYEEGPPPPYEAPQEVAKVDQLAWVKDAQKRLQEATDRQAHALAEVQAQAEALRAARGQIESQADAQRAELLRAMEEIQRRLAEALAQQGQMAEELKRTGQGAPPPPGTSPDILVESLRQMQARLDQQALESSRALTAQTEERVVHFAMLAELQQQLRPRQPVLQVVPMPAPPPPPPPVHVPVPQTTAPAPAPRVEANVRPPPQRVEVEVQTIPPDSERKAPVPSFTEAPPPGERSVPPGPQARSATEISSSEFADSSSSGRSPGEVSASWPLRWIGVEGHRSPGEAGVHSVGEELSLGEVVSVTSYEAREDQFRIQEVDGISEGEVDFALEAGEIPQFRPASEGEVSEGELVHAMRGLYSGRPTQ